MLALVAMEAPVKYVGFGGVDTIRDCRVNVLRCMEEIMIEDCIFGEYEETDPPQSVHIPSSADTTIDTRNIPDTTATTVTTKKKTPPYVALKAYVRNSRWEGVPFILQGTRMLYGVLVYIE